MANRIQLRRDTAANWTRVNPVLEDGEPGLEIETNRVKYGDGNTTWTNLSYSGGGSASFDYSTVQEGSSGPSNITSITGGDDTGVSLTSENWAQLMWVPETANVTIEDIGDGPATYTWAYVDDEGFHVEASVDEVKREWRFTTDGNLELPLGGKIGEVPSPTFVGNAVVITPADVTDDNQQLMIYPTQNEGNHLHMTSGNLAVTDIFLGDDYQYIRTRTDQGMTIGTGGGEMWSGNAWTFGANGILSTPGNVQVGNVATYGNISFVNTIRANNYAYANGVSILSGIAGGATDKLTNGAYEVALQANGVVTLGGTATLSNDGEFRIWADNDITVYRNGQDGYGIKAGNIENYTNNGLRTVVNSSGLEIKTGNLIIPNDKAVVYANGVNILDGVAGTYGNTEVAAYLAGNVTTGNLTVGNLIVTGNSSVINTESYVVEDNIIQMANANPADTLDLGFVAHRTVGGILQHTGLVRDASAGNWKLFSNVVAQPGSTVDFTDVVYDSLQLSGLGASSVTLTGPINFTASPPAFSTPGIQWPSGWQGDIYGNTQVASYLSANPQAGTYSNTNVAAYLTTQNITSANIGAFQTYANATFSTGAGSTYSNANVVANLQNFATSISTTANVTTTANIIAPNYLFANGVNILSTVSGGGGGSYANADVAAYLAANSAIYLGNPVTRPLLQANATQVFVGNATTVAQGGAGALGSTFIMNNAYYNTAGVMTARNTSASGAGQFEILGGTFNWNAASSATAGSATGMGVRMTLNSSALATQNGLSITSAGTLTVNGASGLVTGQAVGALFNTTATTINLGGAATTINMGASTVAVSVGSGTGSITVGSVNTTNIYTSNAVIAGGYISGTANIAITSAGNISGVGNIIGATSNTTITAGAAVTSFLSNGVMTTANVVASGNVTAAYYVGSGSQLTGVATSVTGSWTVATGTNNYSFTVDQNGTYMLWVLGNIPNGIIKWNATATISNNNVPVVGAQYAWVYTGGTTPIDFTSIPNQFVGTANTIVRSVGTGVASTNTFTFGITNSSGASCTVNYGYIKL